MEDFEAIHNFSVKSVMENKPNTILVKVWKSKIRSILVEARESFNEWIDTFTIKFMKSLSKIEHSKEMAEHGD